jgi:hypothetical protein
LSAIGVRHADRRAEGRVHGPHAVPAGDGGQTPPNRTIEGPGVLVNLQILEVEYALSYSK